MTELYLFENSNFGSVHSIKCGVVASVHHIQYDQNWWGPNFLEKVTQRGPIFPKKGTFFKQKGDPTRLLAFLLPAGGGENSA